MSLYMMHNPRRLPTSIVYSSQLFSLGTAFGYVRGSATP